MIHLPNILHDFVNKNKPKGVPKQDYRRAVIQSILHQGSITINGIDYKVGFKEGKTGGKDLFLLCPKCDRLCRSLPCLKCFPRKKDTNTSPQHKILKRSLRYPHNPKYQDALKTLFKSLNRRIKGY